MGMGPLKGILNIRFLQHILFWSVALVFWLLTMWVGSSFKDVIEFEPILMTLIFNACFAVGVYGNLYVILPLFFKRRKFFLYFFFLILLMSGISVFIDFLLVYPLKSFVRDEEYFSQLSFFVWGNFFIILAIYVGITTSISMIREWFQLQKLSMKIKDVEKDKLEAELKALKAQINPHFLFNSLNNIYSLTLDHSDKAPALVLKLSDMMRYILYECNDRFVLLDKEMEFIRNYLDLQRIRLDEAIPVRMETKGEAGNQMIAPLLFEPLIENAFKHGLGNRNSNAFVNIIFNFERYGYLDLLIENSKQPEIGPEGNGQNGIGIRNVIRRLELLYPGKHELNIEESKDRFKLLLNIELK